MDALARTVASATGHEEDQIGAFVTGLLEQMVDQGLVRNDIDARQLSVWLVHAAHAPSALDDRATARLLIASLQPGRIVPGDSADAVTPG